MTTYRAKAEVLFKRKHERVCAPAARPTVAEQGEWFDGNWRRDHGHVKLKETPVADRGKLNWHPLRQHATGNSTVSFRRDDADRIPCKPVPVPGDPPAAVALMMAEYEERKRAYEQYRSQQRGR